MGWGRDRRGGHARTSLARGLKLRGAAVLPIASDGAGADLHHVAGVGPQPVQLHRVLLAGHGGGDALTLQHQQESTGISVGPEASCPCPPPGPPHGPLGIQGLTPKGP